MRHGPHGFARPYPHMFGLGFCVYRSGLSLEVFGVGFPLLEIEAGPDPSLVPQWRYDISLH